MTPSDVRSAEEQALEAEREQALERAEAEYFGPRFLARLHARLHRNPVTSVITKIVVTTVGTLVFLAGVVMMVTPGPGIVGMIMGLAILSTEWRWADKWLDTARAYAKRAAEKALEMDPAVRRRRLAVIALSVLAVVLLVSGLITRFGWPEAAVDGWDWVQGLVAGLPDLPGIET